MLGQVGAMGSGFGRLGGIKGNAGATFALSDLYASGESGSAIDLTSTSNLFQDAARSTPVASDSDPVGGVTDQSGNGAHASQSTSTARPLWDATNSRVVLDGADDALNITLPAISGGQIAIVTSDGMWVEDFDYAGGTFTVGGSDDNYTTDNGAIRGILNVIGLNFYALVIIDRALTAGEIASLLSLYASCPGQFTLSAEVFTDPGFDDAGEWSTSANWTVASSKAASDGGTGYLQNAAVTTIGYDYLMTIEVTSFTSGFLQACDPNVLYNYPQSTGNHRAAFPATGTNIRYRGVSLLGEIDNASAKRIISP